MHFLQIILPHQLWLTLTYLRVLFHLRSFWKNQSPPLCRACWRVATSSCFQGWGREWQQTWGRPFLHPYWGTYSSMLEKKECMVTVKATITRKDAGFILMAIIKIMGGLHLQSNIFFVSGKMWLSLMSIKPGSWWIVWLLTFRSLSHPLNWSSLRFDILYLCCKISNMLYSFSLLITISFAIFACLQGLRSITQTVGCFVSLYFISPKLTGLTVVVLPCLVGAGALMGSVLRKLSRLAQEQVIPN